ncbi:MAG TPA: phosphotriesterase [bacterium]|nr:phosphotriesterase [bacterium]
MRKCKKAVISRRSFFKTGLSGFAGLIASHDLSARWNNITENQSKRRHIQTVTGAISPDTMGFTLPHEHVMCDFVGADRISKERYNPDEIIKTILPYLQEIKRLGVRTFIDCTPAYIGRDPEILARLSYATGIYILTNTGFYKEPYLPKFTREVSAERLADMWAVEILEGINETGIKAGFIKIAVNPGPLIPIQKKIVTAAGRTNKMTGATIASHTVKGVAAIEQLDILEREKVDPASFIYVHASGEPDQKYHFRVAQRGAWVEYDSIRKESCEKHIELIFTMLDKGYEDNLLLSQDSGWYRVGEPHGGKINGYSYLVQEFLPILESKGVGKELIHKLTVLNPNRAFTIQM